MHGYDVGISNGSFFCAKEIIIEDDVMIGVNYAITDTDHHPIDYEARMNGTFGTKLSGLR